MDKFAKEKKMLITYRHACTLQFLFIFFSRLSTKVPHLSIESLICKCEIRQTLRLPYFMLIFPVTYIVTAVLLPTTPTCEI